MDNSVAVLPLDIHKRFSMATPMNRDGEVLEKVRVEHGDQVAMRAQLVELAQGADVVMEATFNWPWIADLVQEVGLRPHLADPRKTGRMRKHSPKSDRKDAIFLGKLWLGGAIFPEVYLAPPPVRSMRALCRQRLLLVRMRTAQKNNIHGQLHRLGIDVSGRVSDIFSPKGRTVLEALELQEHERSLLEHKLTVVDVFMAFTSDLQEEILQELEQDPRSEILMSIPGIGQILAYTLLAEIGELHRFPHRRALAAYAGVLPLERESGGKDFGRHTGGPCNHWLRWAAIEAATGAVRGSASMRSLHSRVKARNKTMPGKARVAVARKLMELVHVLLTRREMYVEPSSEDDASPASQPRRRRSRRRRRRGRDRTHVAGAGSRSRRASDGPGHPNRASQTAPSAASAAGR